MFRIDKYEILTDLKIKVCFNKKQLILKRSGKFPPIIEFLVENNINYIAETINYPHIIFFIYGEKFYISSFDDDYYIISKLNNENYLIDQTDQAISFINEQCDLIYKNIKF